MIKDYNKKLLFGERYQPIISSLLEVDRYKFRMLEIIYNKYRFMDVKFSFLNRTKKIRLADYVDLGEFQIQINYVTSLVIDDSVVDELRRRNMGDEGFLQALKEIRLCTPVISREPDGQIYIEVYGKWMDVTLWETIILHIVTQLYSKGYVEKHGIDCGQLMKKAEIILLENIEILKKLTWPILLFDHRRALSSYWERRTTDIFLNEIPDKIAAISNVQIAKEFGFKDGGTIAHEMTMGVYALRLWEDKEAAFNSQYEVVNNMIQFYPYKDRYILSDTFGTPQFIQNMPEQMAHDTCGFRQDSGNPKVIGDLVIKDCYQRFGIDTMTKRLVPSDGLTAVSMLDLNMYFQDRIDGGFGLGSSKSNNTGGMIPNISSVMKLTWAVGKYTVKISDDQGKLISESEQAKAEALRIFGGITDYRTDPLF